MCFSSFISLQERNVVTVVSESDSFHGSIILVVEITISVCDISVRLLFDIRLLSFTDNLRVFVYILKCVYLFSPVLQDI